MSNGTSDKIYSDLKLFFKKFIKFALVLIVIIIASGASYYLYVEHERNQRESQVINKALPFTQSPAPWVFVRDDFGTKKIIKLWMVEDTNNHAIVQVDGKYSVFRTRINSYKNLEFYHEAGDACKFVDVKIEKGKGITSISCDFKDYYGGLVKRNQ